jgi:hypothetical protein
MAVTIEDGSFVGKDAEGNVVRVRGFTDNDINKIKGALSDIKQIKTDLKSINVGQKELAYKDYTAVANQADMPTGVYFLVPMTADNTFVAFDKVTGKPTDTTKKVDHFVIMYKSTGADGKVSNLGTQNTHTNIDGLAQLGGDNSFTGSNTFTKPLTVATPTGTSHATTKGYVDELVNTKDGNYVHKAGNEDVSGVKNFTSSPLVPITELNSLADNQVPSTKAVKSIVSSFIKYSETKPSAESVEENSLVMYPAEDNI